MGLIFLCGLPGVGKTTVGKMLARARGRPLIDLDDEIQIRAQKSITEIFEQDGEEEFRELEASTLARVCTQVAEGIVVLGAGALMREENRQQVESIGTLVYLKASPDVIASRCADWSERPLMIDASSRSQVKARLDELMSLRSIGYSSARYIIEIGFEMSAEDVAAAVSSALLDS